MLGKFAPLHRAPPSCCISRPALFKLLGCQVAPKLMGARNAHSCWTALRLLLDCAPQSTGTASCSCRAFCSYQTCTRLTCLASVVWQWEPLRNDVLMSRWSTAQTVDRASSWSSGPGLLWFSHLPVTSSRQNMVLRRHSLVWPDVISVTEMQSWKCI